jgi:thioredoxin 1
LNTNFYKLFIPNVAMTNNNLVPELMNGEFETFVKEGFVFLDFFAEWCMPCMMMTPIVEDLSEEFKGKMKFGKVNIDDDQDLAHKFNVSSIPSFFILKDGKVLENVNGSVTQEELEEMIRRYV